MVLIPISSITSYSNADSFSVPTLCNFPPMKRKINFIITYLSGIAQDWFKVALQQEDLGYAQPWLFTWHLFVEEL